MTRLKVPSLATFAEVAGTAGPLRPGGPMLALITTDQTVTAADLVARYAASWAIEVTFFDTRQILGVGQGPQPHRASARGPSGCTSTPSSSSGTRYPATSPRSSPTAVSTRPWYLFDSDPPSCRTPIWAYTT